MLEAWLEAAAREAGVRGVEPSLVSADAVDVVLDLARDAAHGVERPAAPLAAFALGLALGRGGGGAGELRAAAQRVAALAKDWEHDPDA